MELKVLVENTMTTLKKLKKLMLSLKIRRKNSERNNNTTIHLHGSNGFYIGLKLILWRKRRGVFSFISAISGCLLLLLFSFSVYFPPPTANNLFVPRHSSVRHVTLSLSFFFLINVVFVILLVKLRQVR